MSMDKKNIIPLVVERKMSRRKSALICVLITLVLAVIFWQVGTLKSGYGLHLDEYFTFSLSNRQRKTDERFFKFSDGKVWSGEELWNEFMTTAGNNKRFDYANVFFNQSEDVHPPLYYILIHTVSSLFPKMDVVKIGLIVNIPLACIAFWQFVWLASKLGLKKYNAIAISALYVLGAGFISYAVLFLRMYCLMTVWVNLLVMVLLEFPPEEKASLKYCVCLELALLGGALTQHYFLIYAFLVCALYAAFVIWDKNWQKLIASIGVAGIAAGLDVMIFPAVIRHIFKSYRGKEALGNALSFDHFRGFLYWFVQRINNSTFGGLLLVILILLFVLILSSWVKGGCNVSKTIRQYSLLAIPACFYVIIISAVAPFKDCRYTIPVTGILYITLFSMLINMTWRLSEHAVIFVLLLSCLTAITSYKNGVVNFRRDYEVLPVPYETTTCLSMYGASVPQNLQAAFSQLRLFKRVIPISDKNWKKYKDINYNCDSLVVFFPKRNKNIRLNFEPKDVLKALQKQNGLLKCEKLSGVGRGRHEAYYLSDRNVQENKQFDGKDFTVNFRSISKARIDVKNMGSGTDVEVLDISDADAEVSAPKWMQNNGSGRIILSRKGELFFKLKCKGDGTLNIWLRGPHIRGDDNKRLPIWVKYSKFVVDGKVMFDGLKPVWHDRPYKFEMDVADGQIVDVQAEWFL